MKVMLVFSPQWIPAMPHLALPVLTAHLRARGVEVIQRDLNLETYDALLSRATLEQALKRLRTQFPGQPRSERVDWALTRGAQIAAQVEDAKAVFRSPAFYDGDKSLRAFEVLSQALDLASLPFYPARLDLLKYTSPAAVDSSRSLMEAVRDPRHNLFLDLFQRLIVPDIAQDKPDILGISIPTMGQMLAGMTLAYLVKQAGLPCHITVGGPHITMLREQLPRAPRLFDLIDSAVVFDGEQPLLQLTEALDGKREITQVSNLIYRAGDEIRANPVVHEARKRDAGPVPDFDGLPLDRYLAPELVLPLMTAHGCYHGLCGFCNVGYGAPDTGVGKAFYPLAVDQLLDQIAALAKYGTRHIFFADEAITPRTLREMSARLAARGAPVNWCGCVRFERALSPELLAGMSRGGGRMLMFGFETASERMIEHMVKGTQRETMSRVLQDSTRAGIWNHTFFFFGFPTETMEDAQDTVNFVYAHQPYIHSASPGEFVLERYSPAHLHPDRFGVKRIVENPDKDLAIYFDYEVASGLDAEEAANLVERLLDVLPTKRYGQYYVHDVYRFLYTSHLHAQGQPLPPWLMDEEPTIQSVRE